LFRAHFGRSELVTRSFATVNGDVVAIPPWWISWVGPDAWAWQAGAVSVRVISGGWYQVPISQRHDWAPGLMSIRLGVGLQFQPGQFVNLGLDLNEERLRRSYSMASPPLQPLEFLVTEVSAGGFTPPLFHRRPGDMIWVQAPALGFFTLEHVPDFASELWLVSTGTGVAPFVSMLRGGCLFPRFQRAVIVQGVRLNSHLAYQEELSEASNGAAPLSYIPLVSREPPSGRALPGRVSGAIDSGELESAAGMRFDPAKSHVMLCGNPEMVTEVTGILGRRGLQRHRRRDPGHITAEKYW
jgi:ferredoxin/flavodoxin---NADP+ reductase